MRAVNDTAPSVSRYTRCQQADCTCTVQEEVGQIQAAFNAKFKEVKTAKHKEMDRIEERLGRVAEIQVRVSNAFSFTCECVPRVAASKPPVTIMHHPNYIPSSLLQKALNVPADAQRLTHYAWDPIEEPGDEMLEVHDSEVHGGLAATVPA